MFLRHGRRTFSTHNLKGRKMNSSLKRKRISLDIPENEDRVRDSVVSAKQGKKPSPKNTPTLPKRKILPGSYNFFLRQGVSIHHTTKEGRVLNRFVLSVSSDGQLFKVRDGGQHVHTVSRGAFRSWLNKHGLITVKGISETSRKNRSGA